MATGIQFSAQVRCPACRQNITTLKGILPFKPEYLTDCDTHLQLWMKADRIETERERKQEARERGKAGGTR